MKTLKQRTKAAASTCTVVWSDATELLIESLKKQGHSRSAAVLLAVETLMKRTTDGRVPRAAPARRQPTRRD